MSEFLTDGSLSFAGGVNSLKPTTVASQQYPDGLGRNQLAWLNSATVRGGGVTCRHGWQYLKGLFTGKIYQGSFLYRPLGGDPYLIVSLSGRLYRVRVDTDNSVDELTTDALRNPEAEERSYFVQGEQFLIIQAGDNVTLPLIWDGTILRRSAGDNLENMGYINQDSFLIPPADGVTVVNVVMNQPYTGSIGDIVILKFEGQFRVSTIGPGNALGLLTISSPYVGFYVHRGVVDAFQVYKRLGDPELPSATAMDYYMGRIWYAQGRNYTAGDIVKGPSGTLAYNFRDSILKVTENPLAVGGDGFTLPAEAGNIRAIKHTSEMDTSLGEGRLYIFTRSSIYRLQVPVSRSDWIATADSTQPLQTVVQSRYGAVSDRCIVSVNEDLFYQTMEPGIRSLALAVRNSGQWANTPISNNETRILQFNDRGLMIFASGIEFSNRMLQTALPTQTAAGVAFQALVPLDFDLISTLEERRPPAWEGMQEGLLFLEVVEGDFGGRQRAFGLVFSRVSSTIQVWEITDHLKGDFNTNGEARVNWVLETPAYTWGQEFLLKELSGGELWVDRVHGEVLFKVEYRPDGDACWHFWNEWIICSARNTCEDVNNPICYPITPYPEGYRQTMALPKPQTECATVMSRPTAIAYQHQVKITVLGWCRIRGFIAYAKPVEKSLYYSLYCPGQRVDSGTTEQIERQQFAASGVSDPFLGPPYPPTGYQFNDPVMQGSSVYLSWTAPDVLVIGQIAVKYTPFIEFVFTVTNYEYPAWSVLASYIVNQRVTFFGIRYVSLTDPNTGNQPDTSPSHWAVDPTEFELYQHDGTNYVKIGDSTGFGSPVVFWDWGTTAFRAQVASQGLDPYSFYIVANAGISATVQSNVFGFTDNCVIAAPTSLIAVPSGPPFEMDFQWNYGAPPDQDFILAIGQTSGGPYSFSDQIVSRFDNGILNVGGFSAGTYFAIVCARNSDTCVSERSNEVTFTL